MQVTTAEQKADFAGFSELPQVDQTARPPVARRPRFDGDVSELPDRACWALQHLLTRRYLSAEADAASQHEKKDQHLSQPPAV